MRRQLLLMLAILASSAALSTAVLRPWEIDRGGGVRMTAPGRMVTLLEQTSSGHVNVSLREALESLFRANSFPDQPTNAGQDDETTAQRSLTINRVPVKRFLRQPWLSAGGRHRAAVAGTLSNAVGYSITRKAAKPKPSMLHSALLDVYILWATKGHTDSVEAESRRPHSVIKVPV